MLKKLSYRVGLAIGTNPLTTAFGGLALLVFCAMGWVNYQITDDPQELWVAPDSRSNLEQSYVIDKFGAFFRINTLWLTPGVGEDAKADVFQKGYLELLYHLQASVEGGETELDGKKYSVDDFCYKPITGKGCIVTSPMQYWRSDLSTLQALTEQQVKETAQCIAPPDATERVCFDRIGTPVMQFAIFGGLRCETPKKNECSSCLLDASGLQVSFLLYNNDYSMASAEAWERDVFIRNVKSFNKAMGQEYHTELSEGQTYNQELMDKVKGVIEDYKKNGTDLMTLKADYLAERSIPDNISQEGSENAFVIVISYILMFLYVGSAIGHVPSTVHSKYALGFSGIFVVIAALISAIGITFYMNSKLTMISAEVVPFLILAIGVDNMFLITRAERQVPEQIVEPKYRVAFALKEIGPSIFVAAFCEALAFFIGMQTDIPALQSFCLVAGLSVITDFFFQITIFLPALVLDQQRIAAKRLDVFCCFRKPDAPDRPRDDIVRKHFNAYFVPFVFRRSTKILTAFITVCLVIIGAFSCVKLERGLNQNVSLVSGSDIFDYFNTLFDYGNAGPPAYVIFNNVNYSDPENLFQMELINAELASLNDTIIPPVYSWVTPFRNFAKKDAGEWSEACGSKYASGLPFDDQMRLFVQIEIDSDCCQKYGICGEQYSLDVIFDDLGRVETTRFRFQHQPLRYQKDFIAGVVETRKATDAFTARLKQNVYVDHTTEGRELPADLNDPEAVSFFAKAKRHVLGRPGVGESAGDKVPTVFCYSLFYVYYDQYTYITGVLAQDVLLGLIAVFVAIQILSSVQISFFITLAVFLVFFELMGFMWLLNEVLGGYPIQQNAVFVVNLVTSLGFGVEFNNHLAMNYMRQTGTKEVRARKALSNMGASVLIGIASTKFIGVIVLAFAPSTLFKLYYFRMYLFIIIFGLFNGLMFLPMLLSVVGPEEDKSEIIEAYKDRKFFEKLQEIQDQDKQQK